MAGNTRTAFMAGNAKPYNHTANVLLSAMKAVGYDKALTLGEVSGHVPELFG
jgi:hypothetical protein